MLHFRPDEAGSSVEKVESVYGEVESQAVLERLGNSVDVLAEDQMTQPQGKVSNRAPIYNFYLVFILAKSLLIYVWAAAINSQY